MTDAEAIEFLSAKLGSKAAVARALNVTQQVVNNWINQGRGIAFSRRSVVWSLVNDHGGNLPREWLHARAA